MIAFWIAAGLISAAAAGLVLHAAAQAARNAGSQDPTLDLYRRQLGEIDDLADRGLIAEGERKGAHAEAARRLLHAADATARPWTADTGLRKPVLAVAAVTPLIALGLYFWVGSPGFADQTFKSRLAAWRATDPAALSAPEMAAVLQTMTVERPKDPEGFRYLAMAHAASDNPSAAARALRRAITLDPKRPDLWSLLGEALVAQGGGEVTPQAQRAFERALTLDPKAVTPRFHLARARIAAGDKAGGVAAWRALQADLPMTDPRRGALASAISQAENAPVTEAPAMPQMDAIRGMVAGLAARLEANPSDGEGWVRLVRSYAVLGDAEKRDTALATARKRFAADPDLLQALDAAAKTEPMT
ncbi:c-type cytochrome biogenesis protein CcmI [Phenylobacterium ferrooxidans]|uniref:C-type cytochrome biogenesis protein CcmI n=1 Tax=Phenylobacterium ferrooxidans TaxID=2982689 RepID=A0ABW6CWV4_9CAUL